MIVLSRYMEHGDEYRSTFICIDEHSIPLIDDSMNVIDDHTPLTLSATCLNYDAIQILLYHGADVNASNPGTGLSALHYVCESTPKLQELETSEDIQLHEVVLVDIIRILIDNGADLEYTALVRTDSLDLIHVSETPLKP
ncbi:hypothetical protein ACOME3_009612 [Neoechinorhynchus agilis]